MRRSTRPAATTVLLGLAMAVSATTAFAGSKGQAVTSGSLTQTHTVFYNTGSNSHGTTYALASWNTRFQRTSGADREISKVQYRALASGYDNSGNLVFKDSGFGTYFPKFGSSNDITWTLQLQWPYLAPYNLPFATYSSQYGSYTRRSGGSVVVQICNNVVFANIGDPTCNLF